MKNATSITAKQQRTCAGCQRVDSKSAMVRIARRDGRVVVDERGTLPGRGSYVHRVAGCIATIARGQTGGIARALRSGVDRASLSGLVTALQAVATSPLANQTV